MCTILSYFSTLSVSDEQWANNCHTDRPQKCSRSWLWRHTRPSWRRPDGRKHWGQTSRRTGRGRVCRLGDGTPLLPALSPSDVAPTRTTRNWPHSQTLSIWPVPKHHIMHTWRRGHLDNLHRSMSLCLHDIFLLLATFPEAVAWR